MAKADLTNIPRALDALIRGSREPLRRRIAEVVRRHYLLELTGRLSELFAPDMMVEEPVYFLNLDGASVTLTGGKEVRAFYETQVGHMFSVHDPVLTVSDAGFWADSTFHFYLTGRELAAQGFPIEPSDNWYTKRNRILMYWPHDRRGRVVGEHVHDHVAVREIVPIATEDVITLDDALRTLTPLIRPLPPFAEE
ncbi:hypothetical protein AB0I81_24940 [Nonomuraea sp. NPDC050404]|uniref:hypothetical protein n=1 Tax=Nonomuraea sp. NPDC050404 TaxID=3155783 RepID=UPI0033D4CB9B